MVPPASRRISRVLRYSGTGSLLPPFNYGAVTLFGWAFLPYSSRLPSILAGPQPQQARPLVWALPLSLAATQRIDLSFSSSGYLDVSVPRVPSRETMCSSHRDGPSVRRVSPFGYLRFYACLRLPVAFRSLPRPSSALGAKASALCSSSLDFFILRPILSDTSQYPGHRLAVPRLMLSHSARNWPVNLLVLSRWSLRIPSQAYLRSNAWFSRSSCVRLSRCAPGTPGFSVLGH